MNTLKLIHPELGLVNERTLSANSHYQRVVKQWKYFYGKKFYECEVKVESPEKEDKYVKPTRNHLRKLIDNRTGEVYDNQKEAAKALKVDEATILNHAQKRIKGRLGYLVRYAY